MAAAVHHKGEPKVTYDPDYPLVGETLGLWRLMRGLGRGGMGEVYEGVYDYLHLLTLHYPPEERGLIRAELAELPRDEQARLASELLGTQLPPEARFAIKVCSARHGTAGHRRFLQEAEMAQRLGDHPYIVTVHAIHTGGGDDSRVGAYRHLNLDTGKHKDVAYMVMDLSEQDYEHTKVSIDDAVHIARCIATALDHAHRQGIVHRDLKPENILGRIEHPLLTDFGIAKELDQSLGLTRTGQVIGTLDYMSPEQATDAKSVDNRTDIYSLGVVLYEMATGGQLPYLHLAQREAALAAIRSERAEPKWPRQHRPDFPRSLERIILKAMAHRPEERYQQASEMLSDLDRYLRGEWLWPIGRVHPRRWLRYLRSRHPRSIALGLVVVALVLLVWVGVLLKQSFDTRRQQLDGLVTEFVVAVDAVADGDEQQLDGDQRGRLLDDLGDDLAQAAADYPDLHERWQAALDRLDRSRWLEVVFAREAQRPVRGPEGRKELGLAFGDIAGTSAELGGLVCNRPVTWHSQHAYGAGVLYCNILVEIPDNGFRLRLTDTPDRHATELRVVDNRLQLVVRRDQQAERLLYDQPVRLPRLVDAVLEVSDRERAGVRFLLPGMRRLQALPEPGLRSGAGTEVELVMPQGTVLKYLQLLPQPFGAD